MNCKTESDPTKQMKREISSIAKNETLTLRRLREAKRVSQNRWSTCLGFKV